jgi:hypothetical protein
VAVVGDDHAMNVATDIAIINNEIAMTSTLRPRADRTRSRGNDLADRALPIRRWKMTPQMPVGRDNAAMITSSVILIENYHQ